ncbi:MAG TPA: hypothetical protein ENJ27_01395, partial [Candidatus Moranbacteria bacterium]|nr:hypothetical protein [Candidatus Moranbacteria bacterium]
MLGEKNKIRVLISMTILLLASGAFFGIDLVKGQTNKTLDISAYILNQENKEIPNGKYKIRFAIYNTVEGGVALWQETQELELVNGIFNAYLGDVKPLPESLNFNNGEYYLGIKIGDDDEASPRKKIGYVPLAWNAHNAGNAEQLQGASLGTKKGDILKLGKKGKIDLKRLPTGTGSKKLILGNDSRLHNQNTDTGTDSIIFNIGDGTALAGGNFDITVSNATNKPTIRFNYLAQKWQYSNDGIIFTDIGGSMTATSQGGTGIDTSSSTGMLSISDGSWSVISNMNLSSNALSVGPYGTNTGETGEMRFLELASNGTNYVGLKSPDDISANQVWTLPSSDGNASQVLTTDGSGQLQWLTAGAGLGAPIASQYVTLATDTGLDSERVLTGTANQITITDGGANGNVTLSTPQDIATTSSPTFSGITLSGLTAGSAIFTGAGGSISQDNTNFFWDDTNNRLGIGTNSPTAYLDLSASTTSQASLRFRSGIVPTTPNAGDIYSDGTNVYFYNGSSWDDLTNTGVSTFIGLSDTPASYTSGSILFTSGAAVTQDNSNFFWDDTNNRLGIGTATPSDMLDIYGTSNALRLSYDATNYGTLSVNSSGEMSFSTSSVTDSALVLGTGLAEDTLIIYDGNAQDYHIGLDDTDDSFKIGLGSALGTTDYLTIDSSGNVTLSSLSTDGVVITASGVLSSEAQLAVARGGTGSSAFTAGSVVFSNGTILTQDNSNFFWDDTNNRLGLGTATPSDMLDIFGTSNALRLSYDALNYATLTSDSSGALSVNSTSTGSGSRMTIGSGIAEDTLIIFDGEDVSGQNYHIGLDDTDDSFKIGLG